MPVLDWALEIKEKMRVSYARPECLPKGEKCNGFSERKGFGKPFMGFGTSFTGLHASLRSKWGTNPFLFFPLQVTLRTPPNTAKADLGFGVGSCPTLKAAVLRAER